jgi:hypothetical protein
MRQPICLREVTTGRTWLTNDIVRVGRHSELEIVLDDTTVSRRHAEIRPVERGWQVIDCGSRNGTYLDGVYLDAHSRHVRSGDVIQFGRVAVIVELQEEMNNVELHEEIWLNGNDPFRMLNLLAPNPSERKLRLFSVAVCRRMGQCAWDSIGCPRYDHDDSHFVCLRQWQCVPGRRAKQNKLDLLSRVVDCAEGRVSASDLSRLRSEFVSAMVENRSVSMDGSAFYFGYPIGESTYIASGHNAFVAAKTLCRNFALAAPEELSQDQDSRPVWCKLLRDIFGNPFRTVRIDPCWLTSPVLTLSQIIHDQQDFSLLSILGDALMDSGCGDEAILQHCYEPGDHYHGCWVIDAIRESINR